jgi:superfamily II DNA or RNA helicase
MWRLNTFLVKSLPSLFSSSTFIKMKLYDHQKKFLDANPNKALLAFEAGTGKTLTAVEWLRTRQKNALVVVPKRIVEKWKKDLGDVRATVVTKEQFKKLEFDNPSALVLDEAHFAGAPLFTKQRSQIAEKVYTFIQKHPDMPVLLLTATPISSNPANLHSLLCYIGVFIPWKKWRDHFYSLEYMPYLPRPAYIPKEGWRLLIQPFLLKYAHIALMEDCVDYLPPITEDIVKTHSEPFEADSEWEPMKAFVEEHRHEQQEKLKEIRSLAAEYRKVVIVVHFRQQIEALAKELSKDRQTYVLHGSVKDQEKVIADAQADNECYFIVQSSLGAGFDLNTFAVMIFASMSYSYTSFVQMKARIRRIHDLKPVRYIYMLAGRCDRGIFNQLKKGKDFDVAEFTKKIQTGGVED